jgi:hypothetical protein
MKSNPLVKVKSMKGDQQVKESNQQVRKPMLVKERNSHGVETVNKQSTNRRNQSIKVRNRQQEQSIN